MAEDLQLDALLRDARNLGKRELAGQGHTMRSLLASPGNAARIMDIRLRGHMQLKLGPGLVDLIEQAPVLNDEGVSATHGCLAHEGESARHLLIANGDVNGHVNARARKMRLAARSLKNIEIKVMSVAASIEVIADTAVNCVSTSSQRRAEWLRTACRSQ